jgi:hypothetical protein
MLGDQVELWPDHGLSPIALIEYVYLTHRIGERRTNAAKLERASPGTAHLAQEIALRTVHLLAAHTPDPVAADAVSRDPLAFLVVAGPFGIPDDQYFFE